MFYNVVPKSGNNDSMYLLERFVSLQDFDIKPRETILAVVDIEENRHYVVFKRERIEQELRPEQLCVLVRNTSFTNTVSVQKNSFLSGLFVIPFIRTFVCRVEVKNWVNAPNNEYYTDLWEPNV